MRINIQSAGSGETTVVTDEHGDKLTHIESITLHMGAKGMHTALVRFGLLFINVAAEVTVSYNHLRELAQAHGYTLVKQ